LPNTLGISLTVELIESTEKLIQTPDKKSGEK
jgi:hypothetical protein